MKSIFPLAESKKANSNRTGSDLVGKGLATALRLLVVE